jgi:hypothetical protein
MRLHSAEDDDGPALIYIDRYTGRFDQHFLAFLICVFLSSHLVHEVTSPQAFEGL